MHAAGVFARGEQAGRSFVAITARSSG
jgi:hypothetical protein